MRHWAGPKSPDLNLYTPGITVGTRLVSRLVLVQARSTLQPTKPKYFAANIPVPDTTGQARGSLRMSKLVRAQSANALICVYRVKCYWIKICSWKHKHKFKSAALQASCHTCTTITNITNFQLNHSYIKETTLTLFARLYVTKYSDFSDAVKTLKLHRVSFHCK